MMSKTTVTQYDKPVYQPESKTLSLFPHCYPSLLDVPFVNSYMCKPLVSKNGLLSSSIIVSFSTISQIKKEEGASEVDR